MVSKNLIYQSAPERAKVDNMIISHPKEDHYWEISDRKPNKALTHRIYPSSVLVLLYATHASVTVTFLNSIYHINEYLRTENKLDVTDFAENRRVYSEIQWLKNQIKGSFFFCLVSLVLKKHCFKYSCLFCMRRGHQQRFIL